MEEIKIWASLYSWEELTDGQKLKVGNSFSKKEYIELYRELKSLKKLESPSANVKTRIMDIPTKKRGIGWMSFTSGIAAALLLGFFLGNLEFHPKFGLNVSLEMADSIPSKTDTIYLTQVDTILQLQEKLVYQTKIKTEYITNDIVLNDCNENENQLSADYKVPVPEFEVELPKMKEKGSSDEMITSIEHSTTEVLRGVVK